jgi:hypothetical protein
MAVDRGFFAFMDLKFGEWPTLLLTFPKASLNNGGDIVLCLAVYCAQQCCFWASRIRIHYYEDPDPSFIKQKD